MGSLKVAYFIGDDEDKGQERGSHGGLRKSHVKCTVVDGDGDGGVVVLGSGNMDRASWFTSQELGVAIEDAAVVKDVWEQLEKRLEGKVERYFGWEMEE